jgi:hypothetical protein
MKEETIYNNNKLMKYYHNDDILEYSYLNTIS